MIIDMMIERLWLDNPLRNFNYLVVCKTSGDALAIDPLDAKRCYAIAQANNWRITQILNTHEHHDHIGGNETLKALTGADIVAHANAKIDKDLGVSDGDTITVGDSIRFDVIDTPGHTMAHICLFTPSSNAPNGASEGASNVQPILFSGDTMFNAGIGNCRSGGHPEALYQTVQRLLTLPDNTRLYPGHDYLVNNLKFTLDREPDNLAAQKMLDKYQNQDPNKAYITTLAEEKTFNVFLRLNSTSLIKKLVDDFALDINELQQNPKSVFLKLRQLRNDW